MRGILSLFKLTSKFKHIDLTVKWSVTLLLRIMFVVLDNVPLNMEKEVKFAGL